MLTKRELYIKSIFIPENKSDKKEYLPEKEVDEIVKKISNIGERYGFIGGKENKNVEKSSKRKHKYDVWVAKEIKKNIDLLNQFDKIRLVLDWAIQTKSDIFIYSFNEAFVVQKDWHEEMFKKYDIEDLQIKEIDNERVVYRCSDKKHFVYILMPKDLPGEGKLMGMCVGGDNYKANVKNNRSIIFSLRDEKNNPHVTTEVNVQNGIVTQQVGKANTCPISEYKNLLIEFLLFATNYEKLKDFETIRLLNLNQTL